MKWVYLLIAILTEVVATGALKASHSFTRLGPSLLTVAGYLVAFYCLSLTLREMPVGAALLFGQRLDMGAIVGMALIIAGVIVINVFSKTVENH